DLSYTGNAERKIVCYYTSWSIYRPGTAKFSPQNINPYLCTHLIYAFGGFTKDNALKPFDKYQDIEKGGYAKFNGLKTYNKNLKTLLAIGGWNEGSSRFSPMFADPDRRREFVKNTIKFLRKNHFDGLDLDWEYPASREGGKPRDKDNYASLVQELREEFERESSKTGRPRLLVSLAMPAGIEHIEKGYDIPRLNEYLDFINLLSYDYHSSYDPAVNHHAPLYPLEEDNEYSYDTELTIDYTVNYLLKNGATPEKLVLGIPTYGRTYTLFNQDATDLGSPADGPGTKGDATGEKGYLAYYEICENLEQSDDWEVVQPNPKAMGPYAYKGDQWVGYDDVEMVRLKAKYANEKKLGGIMFWTIDNDDFRGKCHGRPYPLIETAKETLLTDSSTSNRNRRKPIRRKEQTNDDSKEESLSNRLTTPEPPTTPDPGTDFKCEDEGFFPHPRDCKKYFWCLESGPGGLGVVAHQFTCPSGLVFNKAADSCDYPRNVACPKSKPSQSTVSTTRAPITAATSRTTYLYSTTRRSTSEKLNTEEDYENKSSTTTTTEAPSTTSKTDKHVAQKEIDIADEEDPKVIKELIMLIKKAGGIEQLEKQLLLQNKSPNNTASSGSENATPATISRTLYERVLNRQAGKIANRQRTPTNANGPGKAQFEGLDEVPEVKGLRRSQKPQYVTIERSKPSTKEPPTEDEDVDEEDVDEDNTDVASSEEQTISNPFLTSSTQRATPNYINIRRPRPSTSRYVSVQRFRSTTPQSTEAVSEVASTSQSPITESVVSSEPPKIDQQVDTTTTTAVINIQPSIGLSSTPNDILIDPETEKPISTTTPEASSTTESVRLVEDSATEILLTTAPASSSTLSSPNTRISTATVSQPRPFGFNRRNRPSTEPTTTPLPSSNDQTRFKVSISSRNHTRSSPLVGRGRLRPKQENAGRNEPINENEQIESSRNVVEETPRSRGRSRGRGVSRYTPPTFRGKTEDPSDSVVRERTRTKENPTSTTINSDPPRRRFRRPTSRSTESTKVNELEDSPIVRIAQSYPRRSLSSRSGNVVKDEVDNEKITNIKVFKKPVSVNRDIYARTKYTRKRNNVETDLFANRSLNDTAATTVITTERPIVNSIDEVDQNSPQMTTTPRAQETTVSLDIETNTVETARTTESVVENEVVAVTDNNESDGREGLDEDLTTTSSSIKIENIDPDVIKIVFPMNSTEANIEGNVNAVPKRRKVVLRRRPVSTSTTAAREEEVENKPVPRRRKVIKRLRPVQNTASTVEDSSAEKDQILLRFESTTAKEDSTDTVAAEISDASTESFSSAMTETVAGTTDFDATNGFTEVTLETTPTAETMIDDSGFSNSDIITMASTIIDNITAIATESTTKEEESLTELGTTESTTSNFLINLTETDDILGETLPLRSDLDTSPTNSYDSVSQSTVSSFQPNRRLEVYNRTYYLDSRYVRKKFVRRRPIGSPPTENTTNNRHPITLTSTDVSSSNERGDLEVLSKRRKSLFVRRRPVSSTTTRTTRLIEQDLITDDKFDDEEDLRLEGQNESENATLRINRAHDETLYPAALSNGKESEEFWNHYTTSSNNGKHLYSVTPQRGITLYETSAKDVETALFENEETHRSSSNLSPEIGPRYRVPASLKKTVSTQGLYYLDSSSEDSEETSNLRTKYQNFRQPRTRYKYHEITRNRGEAKEESVPDATQSPSFDSSTHVRTRFYAKRPVSSTEPPVTETLIPAKKFDYAADAYRRQQSRRTTPRMQGEDSTTLTSLNEERAEVQNLVDGDYVTTPSPQPLVTRLVTSVEESATTERQKILIKTKYSSLTSTTKIPLQTTVARLDYPSTTVSPISGTLERSTDSSDEANEDESINEIRQAQVERSTLPIEGEFLYQARFTTESHESSTIEIESVASSEVNRLPTLKELIGYQTNNYTSSPSPIFLSLFPLKTKNKEVLSREKDANSILEETTVREDIISNDTESKSWMTNKHDKKEERSNTVQNDLDLSIDDIDAYYVDDNSAVDDDDTSLTNKKRIDREGPLTTTLKPTTMRGIPLVNLLKSKVPRGFYVTRSETEHPISEKLEDEALTTEFTTPLIERNYNVPDKIERPDMDRKMDSDLQDDDEENSKSSTEVTLNSYLSKNNNGDVVRIKDEVDSATSLMDQEHTEKYIPTTPDVSSIVDFTEIENLEKDITSSASSAITIPIHPTPITSTPSSPTEPEPSIVSKSIDTMTETSLTNNNNNTNDNSIVTDETTSISVTEVQSNVVSRTSVSEPVTEAELYSENRTYAADLENGYSTNGKIGKTYTDEDGKNSTRNNEDSKLTSSLTTTTFSSTSVAELVEAPTTRTERTLNKSNLRRQKTRFNPSYEFGRKSGNRHYVSPAAKEGQEDSIEEVRTQYPRRRIINYRKSQRRRVVTTRTTNNSLVYETTTRYVKKTKANNRVRNLNDRERSYKEETSVGKKLMPKTYQTGNKAVFKEEHLRIEENIDRFEPEVNSSKNTVTTRTPGNLPSTRLRKPSTFNSTSLQSKTANTFANHRKTHLTDGKFQTHVNETLDAMDERTETPKPEKDIDQSSRAQEIAVTLADPPSPQSSATGRPLLRNALRRKISTTVAPRTDATTSRATLRFTPTHRGRQKAKTKDKTQQNVTTRPIRPPVIDYDYYEDEEEPVIGKSNFNGKLFLTNKGTIRCLDQGNFPHPDSCKKFITCAKMVNGLVIGAEYTCPDKLSFDPVGGICNWSAGLGCKE
ncbi:Acidic mammalian chitinase, partial [Eufriesea mexicana]